MVSITNVKNVNQKETRTITKAETSLDKAEFDYVVDNNSDIESLIENIQKNHKESSPGSDGGRGSG